MRIKKIVLLLFVLGISPLFGQSTAQRIKDLVNQKEFEQAAPLLQQAARENPKDADLFVVLGDVYSELDKLDSALIMYKKADDIKDDQPYIMRKIGTTLSALGRHGEAIDELKAASKESKGDVKDELALGDAYIKADSISQATLIVTRVREKNKSMAEPYVTLGNLYFAQGVFELARQNYEQALSLNENLMDARIKLATSYYQLANKEIDQTLSQELFKRSLNEWNTITQKDPKNARAWFEQGKIFFLASDWGKAAQSLNQFVQLRPSGSLGRWYLAQSLVQLGKCDDAVPHLNIVQQEIDSVRNKARMQLASCLYEQKNYSASVEAYTALKDSNQLTDVKDVERFASALFKAGDTARAITVYKEVLDKDPSRCGLAYQIGNLMLYMKNYSDAIYFYNKFLTACPEDSMANKAIYYTGVSYSQTSKPDSAYIYFKRLIQNEPNNLTARVGLGDVYAALKKSDSAKTEFRDVIAIGTKDPKTYEKELTQAYAKYSGLLLEEKAYPELLKYAKMWAETDPKSQYAWLYQAIGYQASNDLENACKSYKRVLQIDPKNQIAAKYVKQLECP